MAADHWFQIAPLFRILIVMFAMSGCVEAQQLQWESEEAKLSPAPTDTTAIARFKFKNIGPAEAKITSVNSSCSCTKVTLEKMNYAPGESGEVTATFTIGVRTGLQEKIILVESNNPALPKKVLRMKVSIPEVAQVKPTFLYWSPNEPLTAKEINVKIMEGVPVKTVTVESSNPIIVAKVEQEKMGEYRIVVTPSATDQPIMATLNIKTDWPLEKPKTFSATIRLSPRK